MKKNLDLSGRLLRLGLSIVLFILAYSSHSFLLLLAAMFTLYEAIASWCIVYQLLGINHCPLDKK